MPETRVLALPVPDRRFDRRLLVIGALVSLPLVASMTAFAPARQPETPAATIDRASRAFNRAKTVRATFDQTLNNPATGSESKASGELVLAQPNRVSVRFTQPSGDRVVGDGTNLWVYLPSAAPNQVIKLPAKGKGVTGVDALGDLLSAPRSKYTVAGGGAATVGGRATRVVHADAEGGGAADRACEGVGRRRGRRGAPARDHRRERARADAAHDDVDAQRDGSGRDLPVRRAGRRARRRPQRARRRLTTRLAGSEVVSRPGRAAR